MSVTPAARLDATGLSCPLPVVKTKLAIEKLAPGEVLEVIATDPGSVADFASWTQVTGHELLSSRQEDGRYVYLIRKAG